MKFLYEKVYSNQYFALILFVTIAILLILFGIVLLAAIKDTKKRKLEELDKLEKENIDALQNKVNTMSNDEEVFGIDKTFKEESKEEPLEFFKSEDEQSKTRDIVLSTPTTENSMNNLLDEFEDEKQSKVINQNEILIENEDLINREIEHKDVVVPKIEIPIPETKPVIENELINKEEPIAQEENIVVQNIVPNLEVPQPSIEESVVDTTITPKVEVPVQEVKEETPSLVDNEDEFELPAIKNVNIEKTVSPNDVSTSGIDFGKTGILNFSNIENETYEIK